MHVVRVQEVCSGAWYKPSLLIVNCCQSVKYNVDHQLVPPDAAQHEHQMYALL